MLFTDKFIESIDNDPIGAIIKACDTVEDFLSEYSESQEWSQDEYDSLLEASALVEIIHKTGACTIGVPVKDTIKDVENSMITGSPDRSRLWQAQTPQGFQYRLIREAFDRADEDGFVATDDASVLERLGHPVQMLEGDYRNIKVTTPEDILIAVALLGGST